MKSFLTALLLVLVLISAHPYGALAGVDAVAWPLLKTLGINLPMQPMTFDMALLYNAEKKLNIYAYPVTVTYRTKTGDRALSVRDMHFYRFRVPALSFIESHAAGLPAQSHQYALCLELRENYGPGSGFTFETELPEEAVVPYGLNVFHECPWT